MDKTTFESFMVGWLLSTIFFCYTAIYKYGKIGYIELTAGLMLTFIGAVLYQFIKFWIRRRKW